MRIDDKKKKHEVFEPAYGSNIFKKGGRDPVVTSVGNLNEPRFGSYCADPEHATICSDRNDTTKRVSLLQKPPRHRVLILNLLAHQDAYLNGAHIAKHFTEF